MKNLFLCNTPFQVMSAIFLQKSSQANGDLILINSFRGIECIGGVIETEHIFSNVLFIDESKIWRSKEKNLIKKRISTLKTYINIDSIILQYMPNISEYTDLYVANRAAINRLFCMYIAEKCPHCKIHYFDDGIGTYDGSVINVKVSDKLFRRLFVGKRAATFEYDSYLYSPELYMKVNPKTKIRINKMPIPETSEELDKVFGIGQEDVFRSQTIIFDTIPEVEFDREGRDIYISLINEVITQKTCIVKPHPRALVKNFECEYFGNSKIPFEVLCYKQDFNKNILVTNFSTAVFTPKLLFDQEPIIIFLYKFVQGHRRNRQAYDDRIVQLFKSLYRDGNRIFVPSTIKELKAILDCI